MPEPQRDISRAATKTYLVEGNQLAEVLDLRQALLARGIDLPRNPPALVGPRGERIELPPQVFDALRQVIDAMSQGMAVTIAPHNARLTTQEAADFLGISRPTLVRLLEEGRIPFEKPGRHRRVLLADLLEYQRLGAESRREALKSMAADDMHDGVYRATSGPPTRTR